jgi:hypothetical protein
LSGGHCLIVKTNKHSIHALVHVGLKRGPEFISIYLETLSLRMSYMSNLYSHLSRIFWVIQPTRESFCDTSSNILEYEWHAPTTIKINKNKSKSKTRVFHSSECRVAFLYGYSCLVEEHQIQLNCSRHSELHFQGLGFRIIALFQMEDCVMKINPLGVYVYGQFSCIQIFLGSCAS